MGLLPTLWTLTGDARMVAGQIPLKSVQLIITSPPFVGARDYGIPASIWGGDKDCVHDWGDELPRAGNAMRQGVSSPGAVSGKLTQASKSVRESRSGRFCKLCGSWQGCLGSEPTTALYVQHLVEVFDAYKSVLREDGQLFVNLGDHWSGTGSGFGTGNFRKGNETYEKAKLDDDCEGQNLVGVPFLFAMAMRENGWIWRSWSPWVKVSRPVPDSVQDRPGSALEVWLQFTQARKPSFWTHPTLPPVRKQPEPDYYWEHRKTEEITTEPQDKKTHKRINRWKSHKIYYDQEAVRIPFADSSLARVAQSTFDMQMGGAKDYAKGVNPSRSARKCVENLAESIANGCTGRFRRNSDWWLESIDLIIGGLYAQLDYWREVKKHGLVVDEAGEVLGFNFNPAMSKLEHSAIYPSEMIEPIIQFGSSPKMCSQCFAPYVRQLEALTKSTYAQVVAEQGISSSEICEQWEAKGKLNNRNTSGTLVPVVNRTVAWLPSCSCNAEAVPCTVLDPFGGSGSTAYAAVKHNRSCISIDVGEKNSKMAAKRIQEEFGMVVDIRSSLNDSI